MRLQTIVIGTTILIAHQSGIMDRVGTEEVSNPLHEVVAVKCDHLELDSRNECAGRYQDGFDSGQLDPVAVLRQHCTRWQNPWEAGSAEPPSACVEKFGGWIDS